MNVWWRAYNEALNDPKLQLLSGDLFKTWFNLICIASGNDGVLPCVADIAFALRLSEEETEKRLSALVDAGLFDRDKTGMKPHNWNARQFKSDVSTERVKRFREKNRNVSETVSSSVSETPPDTETETEKDTLSEKVTNPRVQARDLGPVVELRHAIQAAYDEVRSIHFPDTGRAEIWISHGWKPEICIAVLRDTLRRKPNVPPKYCDQAIAEAHAAPVVGPRSTGPPRNGQSPNMVDLVLERMNELARETGKNRTAAHAGESSTGVVIDAQRG